jgi:hypothetical protein
MRRTVPILHIIMINALNTFVTILIICFTKINRMGITPTFHQIMIRNTLITPWDIKLEHCTIIDILLLTLSNVIDKVRVGALVTSMTGVTFALVAMVASETFFAFVDILLELTIGD